MPFGRGTVRAPKHVDVLAGEFEDTRQRYLEDVDAHAAATNDRHAHVTNRLSVLEQEQQKLAALQDRIAAS